jgi:hypothetical protein
MIVVTLTPGEIQHAILEGGIRRANALRRNARDNFEVMSEFEAWMSHINSAGCEMAVAKLFHRYWSGVEDINAPDVYGLQVRTSKCNSLPIRKKDSDDDCFVFVKGQIPQFTIHGWIMGSEARAKFPATDPQNRGCAAHFVPIAALHPIEELLNGNLESLEVF